MEVLSVVAVQVGVAEVSFEGGNNIAVLITHFCVI